MGAECQHIIGRLEVKGNDAAHAVGFSKIACCPMGIILSHDRIVGLATAS